MSHRSGQYTEYPHHGAYNHGRPLQRSAATAAVIPMQLPVASASDDYTLVHAGKQVRIGPVLFWIAVGTVTLLGLWSAATAT
jgi:hypothetical protein